jgi:hypothetical protein
MYCWYASVDDRLLNTTKCVPMYSQPNGTTFGWYQISGSDTSKITLADYEQNGKYCQSGLAYPVNANTARCTSMTWMRYNGKLINEPFPCDPTALTTRCNIMFGINPADSPYTSVGTRGYVEVPCKCSFGGPNDPIGFCSSIIGHDKYQQAV